MTLKYYIDKYLTKNIQESLYDTNFDKYLLEFLEQKAGAGVKIFWEKSKSEENRGRGVS